MSLVKFAVAVKNFFLHIRTSRNADFERMRRELQSAAETVKQQAAKAKEDADYIALCHEQLKEKDGEIKVLKEENQKLREGNQGAGEKTPSVDFPGKGMLSRQLIEKAGKELYPGEFSDRVRLAMRFCAQSKSGVDKRTKSVLKNLFGRTKYTGGSNKLKTRIKNTCKDHKKMPAAVGRLLDSFSFEKRGSKHTVYSPPADLPGIERVVLSQSPSAPGSVKRQESELIHTFGLQDI